MTSENSASRQRGDSTGTKSAIADEATSSGPHYTGKPGSALSEPGSRRKSESEKEALRAAGFIQAQGPGWCCACGNKILRGQWIMKMPESFVGKRVTKHHYAHRACAVAVAAEMASAS